MTKAHENRRLRLKLHALIDIGNYSLGSTVRKKIITL
jgi:hypothetical protein